jgi:hypothetical protein
MTASKGNRLSGESSPYLRQHAQNPVDWFPWGPEALTRARDEDKPIFLSIGYSACHWCHVMERESFEDPLIASVLNDNFICIKVDREERPEIDQIYMLAVQMLTGHGGWPMSVFLHPDQKPFFGGTYFPPEDRYGRPGFLRLVRSIAAWWKNQREELVSKGNQISQSIGDYQNRGIFGAKESSAEPTMTLVDFALKQLSDSHDRVHGGFGEAPKFPHPMDIRFLLQAGSRRNDESLVKMATHSLTRMARGGIFDHLKGGFARYSTDRIWLVPHFEKMLYDNALLIAAYTEGWQLTREPLFQSTVEQTIDWILSEMTDEGGGFYSAIDADSEHEEGKFYVWSQEEIRSALGPEKYPIFEKAYGVSTEGNWEGNNILRIAGTPEELSRENSDSQHTNPGQIRDALEECKILLLNIRNSRVRPGLDNKVLTSWNGLTIRALALAGRVFDRPDWVDAAKVAARFLLEHVRDTDGFWHHSWSRISGPKHNAVLEDYSYLLDGLIELALVDPAGCWTGEATRLANTMIDNFFDPPTNTFFFTANDHETLLVRPRESSDQATPSATAMAITGLYRLGRLTQEDNFLKIAWMTLCAHVHLMAKNPQSMSQMIMVVESWLSGDGEWILFGLDKNTRAGRALAARYQGMNLFLNGDEAGSFKLVQDKSAIRDEPTLFVCKNGACEVTRIGIDAIFDFAKATV